MMEWAVEREWPNHVSISDVLKTTDYVGQSVFIYHLSYDEKMIKAVWCQLAWLGETLLQVCSRACDVFSVKAPPFEDSVVYTNEYQSLFFL